MRKLEPMVIGESESYLAFSKPSGMLTLPDRHDAERDSLRGWIQKKYGEVWVVHRLDKDTSGLILLAKNEAAHKYFSQLFETRMITKMYKGIVMGKPLHEKGQINQPIAEHPAKNGTMVIHAKGKNSITDYQVVKSWNKYSLLNFDLKTGRTHQIRVHCKHVGHPIVCDPFYGDGKPVLLSDFKKKFNLSKDVEQETPLLSRLGLHAFSLSFTDEKGNPVYLEAPLPKDMSALVSQLDKNKV